MATSRRFLNPGPMRAPWMKSRTPGPPCAECTPGDGTYCCEIQPENAKCAGAWEGICHKIWVETFGTKPWES